MAARNITSSGPRYVGPSASLEVEKKIYDYLYEEGAQLFEDIHEAIGMELSYVRTRLQCLVADGQVIKEKVARHKGDKRWYFYVP